MISDPRLPLAPDGIFASFQGEGAMAGVPMVFVRLAGCSVGCPACDTDYRVAERATAGEIVARVDALPGSSRVWITGGEPTDHDLLPLLRAIQGRWVGLATAGHRPIDPAWRARVDWLSVSPHDHVLWRQRYGHELKVVPGLGRARLAEFADDPDSCRFAHRYAQPLHDAPASLVDCMNFVRDHPTWRLGAQAHRDSWGMP